MNCKPGDLAIIVRSVAGNGGRIVRVTSFIGEISGWAGDDRWELERDITPLKSLYGVPHWHYRDSELLPIRPQSDDTDCNSKAWLPPVPQKEVA